MKTRIRTITAKDRLYMRKQAFIYACQVYKARRKDDQWGFGAVVLTYYAYSTGYLELLLFGELIR